MYANESGMRRSYASQEKQSGKIRCKTKTTCTPFNEAGGVKTKCIRSAVERAGARTANRREPRFARGLFWLGKLRRAARPFSRRSNAVGSWRPSRSDSSWHHGIHSREEIFVERC